MPRRSVDKQPIKSEADAVGFIPTTPDDWMTPLPKSTQKALDDLAGESPMSAILHATATITTATTTELLAVASGKKCVIYELDAFCDNGNTNDQAVEFKFDSTRIRKHGGIAPGSGYVVPGGGGRIAQGTDGQDVDIVTGAAETVDVAISYRLENA